MSVLLEDALVCPAVQERLEDEAREGKKLCSVEGKNGRKRRCEMKMKHLQKLSRDVTQKNARGVLHKGEKEKKHTHKKEVTHTR